MAIFISSSPRDIRKSRYCQDKTSANVASSARNKNRHSMFSMNLLVKTLKLTKQGLCETTRNTEQGSLGQRDMVSRESTNRYEYLH